MKGKSALPSLSSLLQHEKGLTFLAIGALLFVGLHPFTYTSLATSFDGLLHLYRLVELDHLIGQGIWFPRWAPDFVFGFGYPIFNFYAPLAYYLSAPLHWVGFSFADTATIFFVTCTFAAAVAMYAFTRTMFEDNNAALVAALAYTYAPTHIYDNFYRSAWGTVLAYALAPFSLWAMLRWYRARRARDWWALALGIAALMLAHNVSALLMLPVIGLAGVVLAVNEYTRKRVHEETRRCFLPVSPSPRLLLYAYLSIALGLALSAFFWLPALVETQYVQTWRLTIPPDFDFHTHFLSVADWFAWPAPAVVGLINPDLVNTVGPIHMLLAIGGMATAVNRRQWLTLYFALILLAALYMTLPASAWLWERVTLLPSLQFPHRFLTLAALCVAVLSAALIAALPVFMRTSASVIASALLIVFSIPLLYPRPLPLVNTNPSLGDLLAHEHKTGALGTTASGEYLPSWVQFIPKSSTFEEAIINGENPQRFDSRSLPPGGKVIAHDTSALSFSLRVTSPAPFRATFRHFYFPGWQGYVDGQSVQTTPSPGQGFSTFEVPAGEHQIALSFTLTPIRERAQVISGLALVITMLFVLLYVVVWRGKQPNILVQSAQTAPLSTYIALGCALLLMKIVVADHFDTPLRVSFDGERVPTVQYARSVGLSHAITWLGYDLATDTALPAQSLDITLYWSAQRELDTVYSSFAHLIDEQANLYAQKDNLHPGGAPTTTWRAREYNADRHRIEIPAGTPPGDYWLEIGMYDPRNGARLQRERASAGELLDRIVLGPIHIRKPAQPLSLAAFGIKQPLERQWLNGLRLLGFTPERDRLPDDDFLRVALFWRKDSSPLYRGVGDGGGGIAMALRLIDHEGQVVSAQRGEPSNNRYPTTRWSAGEIVRDNRALWIPRTLPRGTYQLQLQVDGDEGWMVLMAIDK